MLIRRIGHPVIAYGPEDGGGGQPPASTPPASTPPVTTPPAGAPWKDGETYNIGDKPWYETLPDTHGRELLTQKAYKTPADLAKAYGELNTLVSGNGMVKMPGENATDSERDAFMKALGRPDSVEGYKDVKWGEGAEPQMIEFGKNLAFKYGLSPEKAQGMADMWNEFVGKTNTEMGEQFRAQNESEIAAIRQREGEKFDAHIAAGQTVVNALGLDKGQLDRVEGAIGASAMIDLFARIGKATQNGSGFLTGLPGGNTVDNMTPEQAKVEISRLEADKDFQEAYQSRTHPQHADKVAQLERLYAKANALIS